jgi:hypothetical protein
LREVGSILAPRGYRAVLSDRAFHRATPTGRWALRLSFIQHPHVDFDVTATVGIGFDAVQDVLHERDGISKRERRTISTVAGELGNIARTGRRRWTVATSDDARIVAPQIVEVFDRIGLPYLVRYAEPSAVLEKLLGDDSDAWLLVSSEEWRWRTALALAYVLGRHDLIETIIARAEEALARNPERRFFPPFAERIREKVAAARAAGSRG